MKNLLLVAFLLLPGLAGAQAVLNGQSYAQTITIPVPERAATSACAPVPEGAATIGLAVKQTFSENFNALDLARKWTPHYDGGYNRAYNAWEGYTNPDKRTQKAAQEQQLYVDPGYKGTAATPQGLNPFTVGGGYLTIRAQPMPDAQKASMYGFPVMSGAATTRKSHVQVYGYFEARIKAPQDLAAVPAFWMLPLHPNSLPEFDIMEGFGKEKDTILTTTHWSNSAGGRVSSGCRLIRPGYQDGFHQYGLLWTPKKMVYYIDRVPVSQIITPAGADRPMYMQLNLAIGGNWVGNLAEPAAMAPVDMVVDNVVAYSVRGPGYPNCIPYINGETLCIGE